jgi:two-component system, NarL family, nitrate/nitrite response regulator NarL
MQIGICDDHLMFGEAFSALLVKRGHKVLACAKSPGDGLATPDRGEIDVWLTDLHFPGIEGTGAVRQLRRALPDIAIVVLTADTDRALLQQALEDGADGAVLKTEGIEEIERLLRRVTSLPFQQRRCQAEGDKAWSQLARSTGSWETRGGGPRMTLREQDVLMRLWQGDSTNAIAEALGVGVSTVRTHLQHLYVKVGVHSRLELVAYSARHGLLQHYRGLPSKVA